jgi:hypothetical protein
MRLRGRHGGLGWSGGGGEGAGRVAAPTVGHDVDEAAQRGHDVDDVSAGVQALEGDRAPEFTGARYRSWAVLSRTIKLVASSTRVAGCGPSSTAFNSVRAAVAAIWRIG